MKIALRNFFSAEPLNLQYRKARLKYFHLKNAWLWERPDLKSEEFADWYVWMQKSNDRSLLQFKKTILAWKGKIKSVTEIGAGTGIFYPKWFADEMNCSIYNFVEPSIRATEMAKNHLSDYLSMTNFFSVGISELPKNLKSDLTFSLRSIDVTGDIDGFIKKCCEISNYIYITFSADANGMLNHTYRWDNRGYFWGAASVEALKKQVLQLKKFDFKIDFVETANNPKGEIHLAMWKKEL